ncbi:hypothetical protein GCM10010136_01680 [Limoniibacter endophyticus]|uniref:Carbohydrate kinase FGGY N-terminal domain-containing protein n=1 Tax=Limoniibacter endophyticus TaxID=1565040 RepID=A0A8J3GEM0_9HYPH|nr:hypothetical protein GCM10010136_01680 [Limoniibacter endophyticus]
MAEKFVLAIDQGTTSTRAILFDEKMRTVAIDQREFRQIFPHSGWVEHDPEEIFATVVTTCRGAIDKAGITAGEIASIGITNQRETVVLWDKKSGKPAHNAIVWQDRRTAHMCRDLKASGRSAGDGADRAPA